MRLAVYTDYSYRRDGGAIYAERAFVLFLARVGGVARAARWSWAGSTRGPGRPHYRLPDTVEFVPLPHYETQLRPVRPADGAATRRSAAFWRALGRRGRRLAARAEPARARVRGARAAARAQGRARRAPGPAALHAQPPSRTGAGPTWRPSVLDGAWRGLLARRVPVIVVGPELARRYRRSRAGCSRSSVSLVSEAEIVAPEEARGAHYDGELRALSVGRLETEKNPLLLADVLARLQRAATPRWRLVVCGEGPLEARARASASASSASASAPTCAATCRSTAACADLYRSATPSCTCPGPRGCRRCCSRRSRPDCRSWRRLSAACPRRSATRRCSCRPGDADAAARALERIAGGRGAAARAWSESGHELARRSTIEAESARVVEFLHG